MYCLGNNTTSLLLLVGENDTVVLCLEPLLGVGLGQLVLDADLAGLTPPATK